MRYLTREQIDVTKWDKCITDAENGMVYSMSWCLDILSDNWAALVVGDYEAVMPLPYRNKYGFRYLYQPRFTQQYGVFSTSRIDSSLVKLFIEGIPAYYRYADFNLNKECFLYNGEQMLSPRNNFILHLNAPYEILRKQFSVNCIMNVKRTERPESAFMKLVKIKDPQVVIDLFAENQLKYSDRFGSSDYKKLVALIERCYKKEEVEILGVCDSNANIFAASVFLKFKNRKVSIFSGSNHEARKEKAMFFLFDRFIRNNAGQDLILDFSGSNEPGLAKFYGGFSSANELYPKLKYNRLPWPLKIIKK